MDTHLVIGVAAAYLLHPGAGFNVDPATLDPRIAADYVGRWMEIIAPAAEAIAW